MFVITRVGGVTSPIRKEPEAQTPFAYFVEVNFPLLNCSNKEPLALVLIDLSGVSSVHVHVHVSMGNLLAELYTCAQIIIEA